MGRRLQALLSVLALAALLMVWRKPGATEADFNRIRGYCYDQSGEGLVPENVAQARFMACMQSDGWEYVPRW